MNKPPPEGHNIRQLPKLPIQMLDTLANLCYTYLHKASTDRQPKGKGNEKMSNSMVITSEEKALKFHFWLKEHTEITNINGFSIDRSNSGSPAGLYFGSTYHIFDIEYIWKERKSLNDWIRTFIK